MGDLVAAVEADDKGRALKALALELAADIEAGVEQGTVAPLAKVLVDTLELIHADSDEAEEGDELAALQSAGATPIRAVTKGSGNGGAKGRSTARGDGRRPGPRAKAGSGRGSAKAS